MHELAITQSMLDLVLDQTHQAGGKKVEKIYLVIGELSGYVEDSVRFYFDHFSKGTLAEGAELCFNMVPATARCRNCGKVFNVKEFEWVCPACGGFSLELTAGNELRVESIEVE